MNATERRVTLVRGSDVVPRRRTVWDMVCGACDGLFPSKSALAEHYSTAHPEETFVRMRRPKITAEPLMTRAKAVQMLADALQGLAKAAGADRGIAAYECRAEYLLGINDRLNARHNAGLSGEVPKKIVL
jgi:hypothetical protein